MATKKTTTEKPATEPAKQPQGFDLMSYLSSMTPEEVDKIVQENPALQQAVGKMAMQEVNEIGQHPLQIYNEPEPFATPRKDTTAVRVIVPGTGLGGKKPVVKIEPKWMIPKLLENGFMLESEFLKIEKGKNLVKMYSQMGELEVPKDQVHVALKAGFFLNKNEVPKVG